VVCLDVDGKLLRVLKSGTLLDCCLTGVAVVWMRGEGYVRRGNRQKRS